MEQFKSWLFQGIKQTQKFSLSTPKKQSQPTLTNSGKTATTNAYKLQDLQKFDLFLKDVSTQDFWTIARRQMWDQKIETSINRGQELSKQLYFVCWRNYVWPLCRIIPSFCLVFIHDLEKLQEKLLCCCDRIVNPLQVQARVRWSVVPNRLPRKISKGFVQVCLALSPSVRMIKGPVTQLRHLDVI